MSIDRIRNLLRDLDNELDSLERDLSDLEDERDELQVMVDNEEYSGDPLAGMIQDLEALSLKWYRESIKDPTCFAQHYAEQLDTLVRQHQ